MARFTCGDALKIPNTDEPLPDIIAGLAPSRISLLFEGPKRRMHPKNRLLKIVNAADPGALPDISLETIYFILYRFGCQFGAQAA